MGKYIRKIRIHITKITEIFLFNCILCVIVSLKYTREGDFSFRDILIL